MITGTVHGMAGLDDILDEVMRARNIDLGPLAATVARIAADDVRDRLAAGETASGSSFAPLKPATLRGEHRSSLPGGSLAATVQAAVDVGAGRVDVTVGWAGAQATKAAFFSLGTDHQVARPLGGLSAQAEQRIESALNDFLRAALGGR